jgi:hypothetical protein
VQYVSPATSVSHCHGFGQQLRRPRSTNPFSATCTLNEARRLPDARVQSLSVVLRKKFWEHSALAS